jgi:hypothetical protein
MTENTEEKKHITSCWGCSFNDELTKLQDIIHPSAIEAAHVKSQ